MSLKICGQVAGRGISSRWFPSQGLEDDHVEITVESTLDPLETSVAGGRDLSRGVGIHRSRRYRIAGTSRFLFQLGRSDVHVFAFVGVERQAAGEEFVEQDTEGVDVGSGADPLAGELFRCGVVGGEKPSSAGRAARTNLGQVERKE